MRPPQFYQWWMYTNNFWTPWPNFLYYRPQRSWGKVIFSEACVKNSVHRGCVHGCLGGVRGCWGGHMWLLVGVLGCWGACMVAGGMCGEGGVCIVNRGSCMAQWGAWRRWHAWDTTRYGDTINELVVRILLECILVLMQFSEKNWPNNSLGPPTLGNPESATVFVKSSGPLIWGFVIFTIRSIFPP